MSDDGSFNEEEYAAYDDDEDEEANAGKDKKVQHVDNPSKSPRAERYKSEDNDDDRDDYKDVRNAKRELDPDKPMSLEEYMTADELASAAAANVARQRREQNNAGDNKYLEYADEHLGEDFEETPWVAPSLEIAWEYRLNSLYRGGKTKLSKINITRAGDIGEGVPMYFQFIKSMIIYFFFATIFSIPSIVFCYFGHKILKEDRDGIGLYRFTVGNIGYNQLETSYVTDSRCVGGKNTELTCTDIFGVQFTLQDISNILLVCEIIQILIYFIIFFDLVRRTKRIKLKSDARICTASDFAVMVENIPPDTTAKDIKEHFSKLYALDQIDWCGRPVLDGAIPVDDISNSKDTSLLHSWIAEVTIYCKIGEILRIYKAKAALMEHLLRMRAFMKMYKHDTTHTHGANIHKFAKYEQKMLQAGATIDSLSQSTLKKAQKYLRQTESSTNDGTVLASKNNKSVKGVPFIAFIIFNYVESKARCIEDYQKYGSFPYNLCMPERLKFKGHRLKVTHAPQPDEILYENVEVPYYKKFIRRTYTAVVALALLIVGFAIILQSSIYKQKFSDEVPDLTYCSTEIPALYKGSYTGYSENTVRIVRPPESGDTSQTLRNLDLQCANLVTGSFYAIYSDTGDFDNPLADYDVSVCNYGGDNSTDTDCPEYGQQKFCPCITASRSDTCKTLRCSTGVSVDVGECSEFPSTTIVGCYCYDSMLTLFSDGILQGFQNIYNTDTACQQFLGNYAFALVLTFVAALCTVVINKILKWAMKRLATMEQHSTIDSEQRATMVKVFIATYVNMAIIALLAYGYIDTLPSIVDKSRVLQGQYSDFNSAWYAQVGSFLLATFILQSFSPLVGSLFAYNITYPLKRLWAHVHIQSQTSHKFPMQADVNALELGPVFDVTVHSAQLFALFFFAMTYGAGMPILMPLSLFTFILYFHIDKLMLCKFNKKPPHIGDAVMMLMLDLLPWAAVIRLAFSCWIYSNEFIFPYSYLRIEYLGQDYINSQKYSKLYNDYLIDHTEHDFYYVNTGSRIPRGNVFPLFALLVIITLVKFIAKTWKMSPIYWIYKIIVFIWKVCKITRGTTSRISPNNKVVTGFELLRRHDPLRSEMAPYTGDYYQYLESEIASTEKGCCGAIKSKPDVTEDELQAGWKLSYNGAHKVKMIQWDKPTRIADVNRNKGSLKKTWEIIAGHGVYSYKLESIPQYATAMLALKEGTENILDDMEDGLGSLKSNNKYTSVLEQYNAKKENKKIQAKEAKKKIENAWKPKGTVAVDNSTNDGEDNKASASNTSNTTKNDTNKKKSESIPIQLSDNLDDFAGVDDDIELPKVKTKRKGKGKDKGMDLYADVA